MLLLLFFVVDVVVVDVIVVLVVVDFASVTMLLHLHDSSIENY